MIFFLSEKEKRSVDHFDHFDHVDHFDHFDHFVWFALFNACFMGDLAKWSERCASIPKIAGSNPSGGSELTSRSDLLLTARGGST
jgi:hypothetical protein